MSAADKLREAAEALILGRAEKERQKLEAEIRAEQAKGGK